MTWPMITPEQEQLLFQLVEADREARQANYPRTIIPARSLSGTSLLINRMEIKADYSDYVELCNKEYLTITGYNRSEPTSAVSAEGLAYYKEKKSALPYQEQLAEERIRWVEHEVVEHYPVPSALLKEAANLLWEAEGEFDFSAIGHKCREALQEFSSLLYNEICPKATTEPLPKTKTHNKMRAVLNHLKPKIGDTDFDLADALMAMWIAIDQLAQKVEHRSQREGRPLEIEDAKRLVLYSHLVIAEIDMLAQKAQS